MSNDVTVNEEEIKNDFLIMAQAHGESEAEAQQKNAGGFEQEKVNEDAAENVSTKTPEILTGEFLGDIYGEGLKEHCPLWDVPEEMRLQLADSHGALIDKYFPGGWIAFFEKYKVEITAAYVSYKFAKTYAGQPRTEEIKKKWEKAESEKEDVPGETDGA